MCRGVILEIKKDGAVVLTKQGEFRFVQASANDNWQVGDEIDFPILHAVHNSTEGTEEVLAEGALIEELPKNTSDRPQVNKRTWRVPSVAVAACLIMTVVLVSAYFVLGADNTTVAYVYMDMNPSVEIAVNKSLEVIDLNGLNEEGQQLASYLTEWSHHSLGAVSLQLFQDAKDRGYLEDKREVLVSTSLLDDYRDQNLDDLIFDTIENVEYDLRQSERFLAGFVEDAVEVEAEDVFHIHQLEVQSDVLQKARDIGASPGKYMLYLTASHYGEELEDLETFLQKPIAELSNDFGGLNRLLKLDYR
jgi:hypothetical protein